MRLAPITGLVGQLLDMSASQDLPTSGFSPGNKWTPGALIQAGGTSDIETSDADIPNWGVCELLYVVNTSSSTFIPGRIVQIDKNFALLDMPNTANTGKPVYVCMTNFSAGNVTRQGGWVLRSGICPVSYSTAATAGAMYFAAAGQATPTLTAGKQILNATCLIAATGAWTRANSLTQSGSPVVKMNTKGCYVGLAISGTGIPASSVISSINVDGLSVVIGSAIGTPVNATATGSVTVTLTHTGYGICHIDRPFVQGNIT